MKRFHMIGLLMVCLSLYTQVGAQSSTETDSTGPTPTSAVEDPRIFHGRWHQVEVHLSLDDSEGLGESAEASLTYSITAQKKVKRQIESGELAIVTQFNHDGTFSHEVIYADPSIRFPAWRETGTWAWDEESQLLTRKAEEMEITTLADAQVIRVSETELVLESKITGGDSKGIVETVRLKRFSEASVGK